MMMMMFNGNSFATSAVLAEVGISSVECHDS